MAKLITPVGPEANHYYRKGRHGMYRTPEGIEFKETVWGCALLQQRAWLRPWYPEDLEVTLTLIWYRKHKKGDVDNRLKPLLDALQGTAYTNDRQVRRLVAERVDDQPQPGFPEGCYHVSVEPYAPA